MAHKAFIVGINTLGLQYSERDAELMRACLERYGYEVIRPEPTKSDINDEFDDLLDYCGKTDTVVVYFSGHGLIERGELFFVLADDSMKSRHKIDINHLVKKFSFRCKASNKLIILDCCHAGAGIADWGPDVSDRFFILTASERLEKSKELDSLEASFLTHHFQQALNEAPPEIVEADKTIRVSALYEWLLKEAKQHNSLENAIQVPLPNLLGNHKANFALATLTDSIEDFPQAVSDEARRKQEAEKRYRELALESCDIIDLANLPEDRQVATRELELRRLYVPLRMRVEEEHYDQTDDDTFETLEKRSQRLLWRDEPREEASQPVPVGARLAKARRLVVLGDPGAGKSTLLRWMATAYLLRLKQDPAWQEVPDVKTLPDEAWLPVLIRCRDLDVDRCRYGSLDDFLRQTFRKNEMAADSDALQAVIKEKLKNGEALLLIDGLDEISNPSARIRLCQQIEQIERAYPKAAIIVTSRIVGYREMGSYRIKHSFEHLTITDFSKEDKENFARRWCPITERPERRIKATDELIKAIHSNNRIERLTGNPMLLTTLALVKRKVGRLPSRRVDLYFEAVRVLLNWRSEVDEPLDHREAEPQLHYLAYAMCDRGQQQLREDEIIDLLNSMRQEYPNVHSIKKRSPEEFLRLLERRTGILVQIGHVRHDGEPKPLFEFRHLTFQEYLAGLALLKGYFPNRDKSRTLPDYVAPLAGRTSIGDELFGDKVVVTEEWREPLRLCVAACNDDDVDNVLNAILSPLPNEDATTTIRPRAILAALCLADEPNVSQTMADRILQRFANKIDARDGCNIGRSELRRAGMELGPSRWGQKLRIYLVQEFCRRNASDREPVGTVYGILIRTTISDNNEAVRAWFGEQITHLASDKEEEVIEATLGIVGLIQPIKLRWNLPPEATQAVKWLMPMLHANGPKAHAAAWGLATLHHKSRKAWQPLRVERETMIALLNNPATDSGVVRWLASILGRERDDQAVEPLIARLDDSDEWVRRAIAEALGEIGDARAVEPLIARLDDSDEWVRRAIAEALGKMGGVQAVELLLARLDDSGAQVRQSVAWALGKIGDAQAVEPLIARLDDSDESVRRAIAEALGKIGDAQAVEPLIARLDDSDKRVRTAVAEALGKIGDAQAVEPLIARLDNSDERVRTAVAEALGEIGDVQAVEPLIGSLDDSHESVREAVVKALGKIGDVQAVEPLIESLDDSHQSVRLFEIGRAHV